MTEALLQIFYLLLIIIGSWGIGYHLLKKIAVLNCLEHFLASTAIGLGAYSIAMFIMGLCGFLDRVIIASFLAISLFPAIYYLAHLFRTHSRKRKKRPCLFIGIPIIIFAVAAFLLFLLCFHPKLETDAFMYHIGVPWAWLQQGSIRPIPYHMHSNFHFLVQMQNLLLISLPGATPALCKLLQWYYAILLSLGAYQSGKRFIGRRAGAVMLCIVFMAMETAAVVKGALIDAGVGFFVSMGIYFLARAISSRRWEHVLLSGIFWGLAYSSKNTGILFFTAAAIACLLLPVIDKNEKGKSIWKIPLVALGIMLLIVLPWFVKNYFFTGNPFYPFLSRWFWVRHDYALVAEGFSQYYAGFEGYAQPLAALSHIFREIPNFLHNISYVGANLMGALLALGILLMGLKWKRISAPQKFLWLLGLIALPMILRTPFARFVMGLYPLAAFVFCAGISLVAAQIKIRRILLMLIMAASALYFVREHVWTPSYGWEVRFVPGHAVVERGWREYLCYHKKEPYKEIIQYIEHNLSRSDKILIIMNNELLIQCPIPFLPNPHMHSPSMMSLLKMQGGETLIFQMLDIYDVTHVLIGVGEADELGLPQNSRYELINQKFDAYLYRIIPPK